MPKIVTVIEVVSSQEWTRNRYFPIIVLAPDVPEVGKKYRCKVSVPGGPGFRDKEVAERNACIALFELVRQVSGKKPLKNLRADLSCETLGDVTIFATWNGNKFELSSN